MADSQISFARGAPSLDIVDADGLREAAVRAFEGDPAGTFSYGTSVGYVPLREWLAERHGVEPANVIVTNGSMQADALLFEVLVQRGDAVVTERPTYDRTLQSLCDRGAEVRMVGLDGDGIDTGELRQLLEDGLSPRLAHIIPNFQNPAGVTLSRERREELLELAERYRFAIFEDDPYGALRFEGESVPSMLELAKGRDARVVYASSFSKTVCPGIRVGYLVGPEDLINDVKKLATSTYISPSMVSQSIVNEFCRSGALDRSIETAIDALRDRAGTLADALERELPEARFTRPDGGYFLWVDLPDGPPASELLAAAEERGVTFVKGSDFLLEGGDNALRLAYSGVTTAEIEEGIGRLAEAARSLGVAA